MASVIFCTSFIYDYFSVAYFVDGTTASGMGIIDHLFDRPDLKFLLIDEIDKLSKKDQKVLLNVMETGILSDVKAKSSKSARQTHMRLSIYATSNDISNLLTPLLSRFIKLNLPEYNLETFTEICHKLLSRKYDKDHETIQAVIRYVWEHTRDVREAIAIAKIVDTSDEVKSIASTLSRYSNEMRASNKREHYRE